MNTTFNEIMSMLEKNKESLDARQYSIIIGHCYNQRRIVQNAVFALKRKKAQVANRSNKGGESL